MSRQKNIVLISCVSQKLDAPHAAEELYISALFKKSLAYAKSLRPDKIFILSAEHGLLPLDRVVAPYNKTLNKMGVNERRAWADEVLEALREECNLDNDHFTILAGMKYREFIFAELKHCEVPMERMTIGKQLSFLTAKTNTMKNYLLELHKLFDSLPKYDSNFNPNDIPKNGIYIFFEEGEKFGKFNRIVRVGTHTGDNQLRSRLKQHLLSAKKDRSIFRKNIGRAILNKSGDDYLAKWNYDLTSRKNKERYGAEIDSQRQMQIEEEVSEYMQANLSFVVFPVETKEERLELEGAIIATIDGRCAPSVNWLGSHSPIAKIYQSGLWLVQGLGGRPITEEQLGRLCELTKYSVS